MFCINLFCENQTVFEYHLNKSPRRKRRLNDKIQTQKILYYRISIMKFRDYSKRQINELFCRGKRKKTQQLLYLSTRTWIAQHKTFIWAYICAQTYKLTANKLKRTHFHEDSRQHRSSSFLSSAAHNPSSIFTTASTSKTDFPYPLMVFCTLGSIFISPL